MAQQSKIYDEAFLNLLLDLTEICDSFDQIAKMARIANILYSPSEPEFTTLHEAIRKIYCQLRKLPQIGREPGPHWDNSPYPRAQGDPVILCHCHSGPGPVGHEGPAGQPGEVVVGRD